MSVQRLKFKEIDKIDLSEISSIIDKKASSSLNPKLDDIVAKNGDLLEVRIAYNSGWDRKSNGLTPDAKKKFLDADKSYHRMTNTNMTIHVGKRDVNKQAELYIKYKYYGEGNPVLWPGCSFHNWGLAIDLAITDTEALIKSLKQNGWKQTNKNNPWHFECSGSRDYEKAANVIKSFRVSKTGLAFRWSEQIAWYYQKTKTLNKRIPTYNNRLQESKAYAQALLSEIESFNIDSQALKSRTNNFNKDVGKFNIEHGKANRLLTEINSMHSSSQRTKKSNEYERILDKLEMESVRIAKEDNAIENENKQALSWNAQLHREIADYRREDDCLTIENKLLKKIAHEIEQHKSNAVLHLKSIETQTWK